MGEGEYLAQIIVIDILQMIILVDLNQLNEKNHVEIDFNNFEPFLLIKIDNLLRSTQSEDLVSQINSNIFFKEFTFTKNDFKDLNTKQELEFADSVVWLDEIFIVFEIKEREKDKPKGSEKWFRNKILTKAVNQVKKTHKYLKNYPKIPITNEKGHTQNINEAKFEDILSVVIYSPNSDFNDEDRFLKFYTSQTIGLVHLFHEEDYIWICNYLITPAEVAEYLFFREKLFQRHSEIINKLPEQYVLGHFLETSSTEQIKLKYIENLSKYNPNLFDFNVKWLIDNFSNKIKLINRENEYYPIISEIAKLNRVELSEFKTRFIRILEECKVDKIHIPYRMYNLRTDCAFVFIPLHKSNSMHWKNALENFTYGNKYDLKAQKSIGVLVFQNIIDNELVLDAYWNFMESTWKYNKEIEDLLSKNNPFRKVKLERTDSRYL